MMRAPSFKQAKADMRLSLFDVLGTPNRHLQHENEKAAER